MRMILCAALVVFLTSPLQADLLDDNFTASGPSEFLVAQADGSVIGTTVNTYSGLVAFRFSGLTSTTPGWFCDAGYCSNDGFNIVINSGLPQGGIYIASTDGTICTSGGALYIDNVFTRIFAENAGVDGWPVLNLSHEYAFVYDVGPTPVQITTGHDGDCGFGDNTGQQDIEIFPVVEGIVEFFLRGDVSGDGLVQINDVIQALAHLFDGLPFTCADALDANDDGNMDISDPTFILIYLFEGGAPPPAPFPLCGIDATDTDVLDCVTGPGCP